MNSTPRCGLKNLCSEPLIHFLLIGTALFLLFELRQEQGGSAALQIVVDSSQVEQLEAQFKRTFLRWPTREEQTALIDGYVRDEVYYREAVALGLDRNDPQVRKRMRRKLEFLLEDLATDPPNDEVLSAYLAEHALKFQVEPKTSFIQIYLNPSKHQNIRAVADRILAQLHDGADPFEFGDTTIMPRRYTLAPQSEMGRFFGKFFAQRLVEAEPGEWMGPLNSGVGIHLVLVTERIEARMPELAEVRPHVEREYLAEFRKQRKEETYAKLLKNYEVIITRPMPTDKAVKSTSVNRQTVEKNR